MTTQVNWQRIRSELTRLADVEELKGEVQRIGNEIRKFDFQSVLSPSAQAKVKTFEKRYNELMRTIAQAQRQMDREFTRILRQVKTHRTDVTKVVAQQKEKLEKVSTDFRKRFSMKTKAAAATAKRAKTAGTSTRKTTAKKATATRKRKKA